MSLNGKLQDFDLTEVLQLLSRGQHTGWLTITSERASEHGPAMPTFAKIYVQAGKLASATCGFRQRIGHRLIDQGLLSREAFRSLLEEQKTRASRQPIGALLIESNAVASDVLLQELRAQLLDVVQTVTGWRSGEFRFEKQPATASQLASADPALSVEHVLLEIHRQRDEVVAAAAAAAGCLAAPEPVATTAA